MYVLTSKFDDALDEYPDEYEILLVAGTQQLSSVSDWKSVEPLAKTTLSKVPVSAVHFRQIESNRKYVDGDFLSELLK